MRDVYWYAQEVIAWLNTEHPSFADRKLLHRFCSGEVSVERLTQARWNLEDELHGLYEMIMDSFFATKY